MEAHHCGQLAYFGSGLGSLSPAMSSQEVQWIDVAPFLESVCEVMSLGEMINAEDFSLSHTMSAVVIGAPKMDPGMVKQNNAAELIQKGLAPLELSAEKVKRSTLWGSCVQDGFVAVLILRNELWELGWLYLGAGQCCLLTRLQLLTCMIGKEENSDLIVSVKERGVFHHVADLGESC